MRSAILEQPRTHELATGPNGKPVAQAPLLVATDGSEGADAALRAARLIAAHTGQRVKIIAVEPPIPIVAPEVQLASTGQMEAEGLEALRRQVRAQLTRLALNGQWPLEVVTGDPGASIANVAQQIGASLVIMGLGGHGVVDRILGGEMMLQVLRLGTVPVLGVAPGFSHLPSRTLTAIDFSASSGRALALAAQVMAPHGKLTAAHVIPSELVPRREGEAGYSSVGGALDRILADVGSSDSVSVDRRVLCGDPTKELMHLAQELTPDLIVAGSHGHNFFTRLLLGSVSTKLIRTAKCSVLVAPPDDGAGFMDELPKSTTQFAFYEWAERLEEFTRRNGGRHATLEVIDPELGAQVESKGATFIGAAFDPRDAHVNLMLAASQTNGEEPHLTRSISGVTAVQMLRDRSGRDLFLRVAHGRGQTLLTLER